MPPNATRSFASSDSLTIPRSAVPHSSDFFLLDSMDRLGVDQSGKQLSAGENTLLMSSVTFTSRHRRGTQGWRTRGTEAAATLTKAWW